MKAPHLFLTAVLALVSTAAFAQTPNTSTVSGGAVGNQAQTGTTTTPSNMHSGASIGNNRDVLSPGTGTPTQVSPASADDRAMRRSKDRTNSNGKMKKKMK